LNRLGRMLAVVLMALTVAVPGMASAAGDKNPLSEVPPEFQPAVDAVAAELGISADSLKNASREELQTLLCSELEGESADDVAARVQKALDEIPESQFEGVSEVERQAVESQLPTIIADMKKACKESGVSDAEETDDSAAEESDDETPTPNRVDAGGGGVNEAGTTGPLVFGGIFAALFGLLGVAIIGMRRRV
jgi:hypothetical protein